VQRDSQLFQGTAREFRRQLVSAGGQLVSARDSFSVQGTSRQCGGTASQCRVQLDSVWGPLDSAEET
jgi:hypothetical protein